MSQNHSNIIQLPKILIPESLNDTLENDGGDKQYHSYSLLQKSQVDTDLSSNSLLSTSELIPNTFSWEL